MDAAVPSAEATEKALNMLTNEVVRLNAIIDKQARALRNLRNVLGPKVPRILDDLPIEKSGPRVEWAEALRILDEVQI